MPAERLQPGLLLGPFRIVRAMAAVGMGVIHEAEQVGLGRRVALKTIRAVDLQLRHVQPLRWKTQLASILERLYQHQAVSKD